VIKGRTNAPKCARVSDGTASSSGSSSTSASTIGASSPASMAFCRSFSASSAFSRWARMRRMSCSIDWRIASLAERWQISAKSAPEKPWVDLARKPRSTSAATGVFLSVAVRIDRRDGSSGSGM